jgi:hypothetical protein
MGATVSVRFTVGEVGMDEPEAVKSTREPVVKLVGVKLVSDAIFGLGGVRGRIRSTAADQVDGGVGCSIFLADHVGRIKRPMGDFPIKRAHATAHAARRHSE